MLSTKAAETAENSPVSICDSEISDVTAVGRGGGRRCGVIALFEFGDADFKIRARDTRSQPIEVLNFQQRSLLSLESSFDTLFG